MMEQINDIFFYRLLNQEEMKEQIFFYQKVLSTGQILLKGDFIFIS